MIKKVLIFLKVISRPRQSLPFTFSPLRSNLAGRGSANPSLLLQRTHPRQNIWKLDFYFFCFLVTRLLTMFLRVLLGLHWIAGSTIRRHFNRQFHTKHLLITLCCFCSIYFSSCIFETSLRPGDGFSINSWENIGFFEHVELFFISPNNIFQHF